MTKPEDLTTRNLVSLVNDFIVLALAGDDDIYDEQKHCRRRLLRLNLIEKEESPADEEDDE